jgi:uncharacterized protein (TIGR03000 family)
MFQQMWKYGGLLALSAAIVLMADTGRAAAQARGYYNSYRPAVPYRSYTPSYPAATSQPANTYYGRPYAYYGYFPPSVASTYIGPAYQPGHPSSVYVGPSGPSEIPQDTYRIQENDRYQAGQRQQTNIDNTAREPADTTAHVTVKVPASAELWFNGSKMKSTGAVRKFQTPPLSSGPQYRYTVRARWQENGQVVTQTRQIRVSPGAHLEVDFPERS